MTSERLEEGFQVRHCALSLVGKLTCFSHLFKTYGLILSQNTGEPIMYPEINKLISLLHERKISTFLVTNAQFPEAIRYVFRLPG